MTAKLILTLGPGTSPQAHGDVVVLDWNKREIIDAHRYTHRVYQQSHKGLSGASWHGPNLLVATEAELLEFEVAPLRVVNNHTFGFLNDVHHLVATDDRIWICNSGADCVEELNPQWQPVETHHLVRRFGRQPAELLRLMRDDARKSWWRLRGRYDFYTHLTDRPAFRNVVKLLDEKAYRKNGRELRYSDLRPHVLHPNHLQAMGDDLWITLWRPGKIVSLRNGKTLVSQLGRPHDGIAFGDEFYVTDCQDNRLLVFEFDQATLTIGERIAEKTVTDTIEQGFLRGVCVKDDTVFVGLTARRGAPANARSARVVALDRRTWNVRDEWAVPQEFGLNIFSILDAGSAYQ